MSKARDLANAGTALGAVTATELGYVDGVTSAIQTQIDSKEPTLPSQTSNAGKYLTTDGSAKSWGTVSQYALPSQTGNSGKYLTTNGTAESWATVNQSTTWTQRTVLGSQINTIAYNGSNLYVAAGDNSLLSTSSDGITWTARTSGFGGSDGIRKVAYGNGLWVAVGENGKITTSTDGITWTARTANMSTNTIRDVIYANSIWVAVGSGGGTTNTGGITYSTDGTTWTRKSQSLTIGNAYYSVIWNGTNWIVGTNSATNNYLYASTPSGTWTVGQTGSAQDIIKLIYDGTRTLELNSVGQLRYSTSTTLGTTTQILGATTQQSETRNFYYNGNIYTIAGFIVVYSTTPEGPGSVYSKTISSSLSPGTRNDSSGALSSASSCIFVNSTGTIATGASGSIFTSF